MTVIPPPPARYASWIAYHGWLDLALLAAEVGPAESADEYDRRLAELDAEVARADRWAQVEWDAGLYDGDSRLVRFQRTRWRLLADRMEAWSLETNERLPIAADNADCIESP